MRDEGARFEGGDPRRRSAACERNRDPLLAVLRRVFPARGVVLEVSAGTGQHAAYFSDALRELRWCPTELDPEALPSIDAWCSLSEGDVALAERLDVRWPRWPVERADAVLCCNMIHIAPWECAEALLAGVGRVLAPDGVFALYGPFQRGGAHTAPSNAEFDAWLRGRDPAWGVRALEAVLALAEGQGLRCEEVLSMPANNLTVVLRRCAE